MHSGPDMPNVHANASRPALIAADTTSGISGEVTCNGHEIVSP
jgi:hypothetical protein